MTATARILIVDDGSSSQRGLVPLLTSRGYHVESAATGMAALEAFDMRPPDVMVLDLGVRDLEGSELCRRVRRRFPSPIIVLSSRGHDADKIAALEEGADDYIAKPFAVEELLGRIRVALQRVFHPRGSGTGRLNVARLTVDFSGRRVLLAGDELNMGAGEFELLAYFARHANRVLPYRTLLTAGLGLQSTAHLWQLVGQLRKKIEPDPVRPRYLVSEPWVGFRLVDGVR